MNMKKRFFSLVVGLVVILVFMWSATISVMAQNYISDKCNEVGGCCYFHITGGGVNINVGGPGRKDNNNSDNINEDAGAPNPIILPSNVDLTITATSYTTSGQRFLKLYRGSSTDGQEIISRGEMAGFPPESTISYKFKSIRSLSDGPYLTPISYKLSIRENLFGQGDDNKCSLYFATTSDENALSGLCCNSNYSYDNGEKSDIFYQTKSHPAKYKATGLCYPNDLDTPMSINKAKSPQSCSVQGDLSSGELVWGTDTTFTDICEQAGPQESQCLSCREKAGLWTAVGCVPIDATEMVLSLIRFLISIAGGIALLLILYGSFSISTSAGNPQKVDEGKQIITAAISGLLFIILSVLILHTIGVEIFRLPSI